MDEKTDQTNQNQNLYNGEQGPNADNVATAEREGADGFTEEGARAFVTRFLDERRQAFPKYLDKDAAREMGLSESQLSQYMKGKYQTPHTITPKIFQFAKLYEKRVKLPETPEYKPTTVSKIVYGLIQYAHVRKKLTVVYGDAGIGKTMAIEEYRRRFPDTTVVVEADPVFESVPALYELLGDELRIAETSARKIQKEAKRRLKNSGRVLVVDEAQLLKTRQIEALRTLAQKCGIGIAFVGNHSLYNKMVGSGKQDYAQIFSRMSDRCAVHANMLTLDDIRLVFENRGLDDDCITMLHQLTTETGFGLRGAVDAQINTALEHGGIVTAERLKPHVNRKNVK